MDYSVASRQQLYILSAYVQMYRYKAERNLGLLVLMRTSQSIWNMCCLLYCFTSSAHLVLSLFYTACVLEHYLVAAKNQIVIEQLWSARGSAGLQLGTQWLWWFGQLASCPQHCLQASPFYSSHSLCPDSSLV